MSETMSPRYVPILKGKLGEFNALEHVSELARENMYPLMEILPSPEQDITADVGKAFDRLGTRLSLPAQRT